MKTTKTHVFRVKPGMELAGAVKEYCEANKITSGIVTGIIGSLSSAKLGFLKELPGKYITKDFTGPLEIAAAQGSIALCGKETVVHIHTLISDEKQAIGGHLTEAQVFSTAEVAIEELDEQIKRKQDEFTGLKELE